MGGGDGLLGRSGVNLDDEASQIADIRVDGAGVRSGVEAGRYLVET